MDAKRFDELSKLLGTTLTRSRLFSVLSVLAVSGLTLTARAELASAAIETFKKKPGKGKKGKKKKGKKKKRTNPSNNCPENRKNAVCHCPPGLGGRTCFVICVGTGGGHDNDEFDCMCAGKIAGVPDCVPGRCPEELPGTRSCDVCRPDGDFAIAATECCSGIYCAGTGRCGACTCTATCTVQTDCTGLGVAGCVCLGLGGPGQAHCGACLPDGTAGGSATECCSGILCAATGRCGACTCAASCTAQPDCTGLGVADCVCRTLEDTCGPCIPDGQSAGSIVECCSNDYCPGHGICGPCPPLTCDVVCSTQETCTDRGAGCICRISQGLCGPCLGNGEAAGSAAECCSGAFCAATERCGPCVCAASCTEPTDCTGLGVADCVCRTRQGACGPCLGNGEDAGSAAECCSGAFCAATERCGPCVCAASCTEPTDCTGLGVADCVCRTLTGQCGGCIPDGGFAGAAAQCCSGTMCGPRCGSCVPQICSGSCGSDATCQVQADQCVCFASGTCNECLTNGAACSATGECCGQLKCLGGQCKIAPATGATKGKRGGRGCTSAGRPCRLDGECCAQSACFQGKCGEKNSHCHHNRECAKGYRCVGGHSIGDHRRCRKNGSKKYHHIKE